MRFFCAIFLLFTVASAQILNVIPYGDGALKIVFDKRVNLANFSYLELKNGAYLQGPEILGPFTRKKFLFKNGAEATVAQYTPTTVRIVMQKTKNQVIKIQAHENFLFVKFEKKSQKISPDPKKIAKKSEKILKIQDLAPKKPKKISKNGIKIMIDPGHGGKDCGAFGVLKICEKTIVLQVSLLLEKELSARGYEVFMTRRKDVYVDLKRRTEMANEKNVHLFISVHANSVARHEHTAQGVESYFFGYG